MLFVHIYCFKYCGGILLDTKAINIFQIAPKWFKTVFIKNYQKITFLIAPKYFAGYKPAKYHYFFIKYDWFIEGFNMLKIECIGYGYPEFYEKSMDDAKIKNDSNEGRVVVLIDELNKFKEDLNLYKETFKNKENNNLYKKSKILNCLVVDLSSDLEWKCIWTKPFNNDETIIFFKYCLEFIKKLIPKLNIIFASIKFDNSLPYSPSLYLLTSNLYFIKDKMNLILDKLDIYEVKRTKIYNKGVIKNTYIKQTIIEKITKKLIQKNKKQYYVLEYGYYEDFDSSWDEIY